jgi:hypothetical protein
MLFFEKDRRKDDLGPLNANVFSGMEHDLAERAPGLNLTGREQGTGNREQGTGNREQGTST